MALTVAVLTVSDRVSRGEADDGSGDTLEELLRDALKRGKPVPIDDKVLIAAAKKVKPSTKEWFATARNHALYANQGGLYDDVVKYLDL